MHHMSIYKYEMNRNTILGLALAGVWFVGLSLGFVAVRFYGDTLVSCLSQAAALPVSIAAPLVTLLPLLLSALAVIVFQPGLLYGICFVRAVTLAMMLQALAVCFNGGVYLAAVFLMFSSLVFSPVLLWYWWRRLALRMENFVPDTLVCMAMGFVIGLMDYWFISPFLVDVINF